MILDTTMCAQVDRRDGVVPARANRVGDVSPLPLVPRPAVHLDELPQAFSDGLMGRHDLLWA